MYIYPDNLKAKARLWLWELRDVAIIGVALLAAVFALAYGIDTTRIYTARSGQEERRQLGQLRRCERSIKSRMPHKQVIRRIELSRQKHLLFAKQHCIFDTLLL